MAAIKAVIAVADVLKADAAEAVAVQLAVLIDAAADLAMALEETAHQDVAAVTVQIDNNKIDKIRACVIAARIFLS